MLQRPRQSSGRQGRGEHGVALMSTVSRGSRCRGTHECGSGKIFVGGDHLGGTVSRSAGGAACDCALLNWSACYRSCLMCTWFRLRSPMLRWRSGPARDPVKRRHARDAASSASGATAATHGASPTSRSQAGLCASTCPYAAFTARCLPAALPTVSEDDRPPAEETTENAAAGSRAGRHAQSLFGPSHDPHRPEL